MNINIVDTAVGNLNTEPQWFKWLKGVIKMNTINKKSNTNEYEVNEQNTQGEAMTIEMKQGPEAIEEITKLLPAVLDKIFPVPVEKLNWYKEIWYEVEEDETEYAAMEDGYEEISYRQQCEHTSEISPVSEQDFIDHFSRKIITGSIEKEDDILGWELCVDLNDRETNHVKSLCLRAYGEDRGQVEDMLLPKLDDYGVEYLINRVVNELRLWIFCDTCVSLAGSFINKIVDEANIGWFYGPLIFPIYTPTPELAEIPGGYTGSVEFRGKTSSNPISIMNAIMECKPVSEMQMLAVLQNPINDTISEAK